MPCLRSASSNVNIIFSLQDLQEVEGSCGFSPLNVMDALQSDCSAWRPKLVDVQWQTDCTRSVICGSITWPAAGCRKKPAPTCQADVCLLVWYGSLSHPVHDVNNGIDRWPWESEIWKYRVSCGSHPRVSQLSVQGRLRNKSATDSCVIALPHKVTWFWPPAVIMHLGKVNRCEKTPAQDSSSITEGTVKADSSKALAIAWSTFRQSLGLW